jgi:hypothetical protein
VLSFPVVVEKKAWYAGTLGMIDYCRGFIHHGGSMLRPHDSEVASISTLLTVEDVSRRLRLSPSYVYVLCTRGLIAHHPNMEVHKRMHGGLMTFDMNAGTFFANHIAPAREKSTFV